jgi:MFS transporter, ACS family, solute carrier family 17 (sodium-dependent inorganic phosphate cotransporter), other
MIDCSSSRSALIITQSSRRTSSSSSSSTYSRSNERYALTIAESSLRRTSRSNELKEEEAVDHRRTDNVFRKSLESSSSSSSRRRRRRRLAIFKASTRSICASTESNEFDRYWTSKGMGWSTKRRARMNVKQANASSSSPSSRTEKSAEGDAEEEAANDEATTNALNSNGSSSNSSGRFKKVENGEESATTTTTTTTTTNVSKARAIESNSTNTILDDDDDVMIANEWAFKFPTSTGDLSNTYHSAPARYKLMLLCACAFVVCNMDKINMSVAVIPMSREFSWDTAQSGILQSSFFYGFALSQVPGGFLNTKYGGAKILPLGLMFISFATLAIPLAGDNLPALFFARALVGLGEGVVPSAVTDIIARTMSVGERSRAVAFTFSGFNVGSVIGLSLAPFITEKLGWRAVFEIFGAAGTLWIVSALTLFKEGGVTQKAIGEGKTPVTNLFGSRQETYSTSLSMEVDTQQPTIKKKEEEDAITFETVPWRQFASSDPIRALAFVHFVGNWGTYVVLAWLPSYFTQEVGLSLTNASLLTLLPPIANIAVGTLAGPTADNLIQGGTDLTLVRKGCQSVAFAAPAFAMLLSTYFDDPYATVGLLTVGIAFQSFSYAGLYSNHQDLSPKYASILLGITNTCGALPGVIGVPLTGYLIKETQEWELSMFGPAIVFYMLGILVFWKWGSGERLVFTPASISGKRK